MMVTLRPDVLDAESAWYHLDLIITTVLEGQHEWAIADADVIEKSPWIETDAGGRAGKRNLEALKKSFTSQAYPRTTKRHQKEVIVTLMPVEGDEHQLTPEQAWGALQAPAYVVVENEESDGGFWLAMMSAWSREDLLEAHRRGWLEFAHMGGIGEVAKVVGRLISKTVGPIRLHVVSDSDRRYPGERTSTIEKVVKSCAAAKVPYTILRKRSIENYLPASVLPKTAAARALAGLTQDQKNHYDMKNGFPCGRRGALIPAVQVRLYNKVPSHVQRDLCGGFGEDIAKVFKTRRVDITAASVIAVCLDDPDEIPRVLDAMESLL